ncbi:hypothetical protein SESBI_12353 [Sesbania bispinosa]|nr:hypothetical protein SESBI_12353 [Sesbania bispinosa]
MGLALYGTVTSAEKVEAPSSSDRFCFSDCVTCPVICSPPPPQLVTITPHTPPPLPSVPSAPHSLSQPPPKSPPPPTPFSGFAPPPPFKSYNTPPSGSSQPLPTVISGPHDFSYPYYYFYASAASSLSIHAPFFVLLLFLIGFSIVG